MKKCVCRLFVIFCMGPCVAGTLARSADTGRPPVIGAWFWSQEVLEPDGFKPFLDAAAAHTPYTLLTTSCRRAEVVEPRVHEQVGKAVRYANALGLNMALEVDLRLARQAFCAQHPDEQQEELVLRMVEFTNGAPAEAVFVGSDTGDHMNGSLPKYECLNTRLRRVYSFVRGPDGIDPATVSDITGESVSAVADGPRKLTVRVPAQPGRSACVIASHACLTPDVFAPHLAAFQRAIIRQYADLPLAGIMKDEWGFPLWYNQTYAKEPDAYVGALWSGALGGGRLNVHPLYPRPDLVGGERDFKLMRSGLMSALTRLRMLDFITRAPLDCPVAVVFGHACAMNWAGPSYNRVGLEVAGALCESGYPADLFPSSLVGAAALRIDAEGYVCLGPQRYRAVVLYQPEFGDEGELAFFARAARGRSAVFRVGGWTRDSSARPLEGTARLGTAVRVCGSDSECAAAVIRFLDEAGGSRVTGWTGRLAGWGQAAGVRHAAPPTDGHSVLTDGTYVRIAGGKNPAGDSICETFVWQGQSVTVDAEGVVAVRFATGGNVAAFAAGGLKRLKTAGLDITLQERTDLAFVAELDGRVKGVFQRRPGGVPAELLAVTTEWRQLPVPTVFPEDAPQH